MAVPWSGLLWARDSGQWLACQRAALMEKSLRPLVTGWWLRPAGRARDRSLQPGLPDMVRGDSQCDILFDAPPETVKCRMQHTVGRLVLESEKCKKEGHPPAPPPEDKSAFILKGFWSDNQRKRLTDTGIPIKAKVKYLGNLFGQVSAEEAYAPHLAQAITRA